MSTFVTRLFVGSGTNTGTLAAPASGDIYITDAFGARVTTAAAAAVLPSIKIISGVNGYSISTPLISRADLNRVGVGSFTEQDYQAPVQQVDTVDFTNFAAGDQVRVKVIFKTNRKLQQGRDSISEVYHTFAAGSTQTAEIDKIVAKINAVGSPGQSPAIFQKYVTASNGGGTTLVLTGKTPPSTGSVLDTPDFTSFQTFVTELVPSGSYGQGTAYTVTNTQGANPGQGTSAQVAFEETFEAGQYGRTDLRSWDRGIGALNTAAGKTYSYIRLSGFKAIEGDLNGLKHTPIRNSLALPAGSAQLSEAQAVLRAFVSGVAVAAPAGE